MNRTTGAGTAATHAESDTALASRMAAGDQRALGVLYDRHGAAAYALACAITTRPATAEVVIADAFAYVWREASTFDPQRMSLLAWLMSIVRAFSLKERASGATVARILVREGDVPERTSAKSLDADAISQSLAMLDAVQARAVELAYFGGKSRTDIARELRMTEGEVTQLLRSAIEAMRRGLAPNALSPDRATPRAAANERGESNPASVDAAAANVISPDSSRAELAT